MPALARHDRVAREAKVSKDSDGYVRAIARGLEVIEALGRAPGRHTLAEVADATDLNRATARRILSTLAALNYCEADGRYFRLRPRALALGMSYLSALPYWGQAQRVLEDLRADVKESCALAVLDGTEIVYVLRQPSRRILSANLSIGSRLPAHVISLGRVLLAGLPAEAREETLKAIDWQRFTDKTITSAKAMRRELDAIAERGYAWIDGEFDPAICGMAVPIRDAGGAVVAAVSVNAISGAIDEQGARERFLLPLRRAAQEIRAGSLPTAPAMRTRGKPSGARGKA